MKEIGGYFELELRKGEEYHSKAIALNTGRNALELILITKKYSKVYIPYYTCDVILEPLKKHDIAYEFYHINIDFEPLFDFKRIKESEGFLYTNYFGIKDKFIEKLAVLCPNLIIDSSQSFFSKPLSNIPTFYSCRKFFGVPDGAYLYLEDAKVLDFPYDHSDHRANHLLKRIEYGASAGYEDFKTNDIKLVGQPILQMSKLTRSLLCNIDYEFVRKRRKENFIFLRKQLSKYNEINIKPEHLNGSMVFPFLSNKPNLRQRLIDNGIYIATYWPNIIEWMKEECLESRFTQQIVHLPVDQRYNSDDMNVIINLILK